MWRQHCFDPIKDKLVPSTLDLLDQDRAGNKQNKTQICNFVAIYILNLVYIFLKTKEQLYLFTFFFFKIIDKVGPNEGQQFYEKEFETKYIERLKVFYQTESTQFLQANGVSLYLKKAEERIDEEKQNADYLGSYLPTSEPKVKKKINFFC